MIRPELSIIVPLFDDRGMADACLASWNAQTCDRERLQLVVIDHGVGETHLRTHLRSHDLWVHASGNESVLYDRGIRASEAPLLMLTEAHCIARPFAAERLLELFCDASLSAAVVASDHIETNALARMQGELEREWFASWPAGHPRTVSLRGFAIRRDAYVALGGFDAKHGRFCETALAIALARDGRRIGRTPETLIAHTNCTNIRELVDALSGCARGQLAWREQVDVALGDEWLGTGTVWHQRAKLRVGKVRLAARVRFAKAVVQWWIMRDLASYRALWERCFELGFADYLCGLESHPPHVLRSSPPPH